MTSVFVRSRDFSPAKISFSSAEWCGHVYEEMLFGPRDIADRYTSYFEDESAERRVQEVKDGIAEEELLVRLRGLRGEWLRPGERRTVPFLPAAFLRRLTHRPLQWTTASIERSGRDEAVTVPAGRFDASTYKISTGDGREGLFHVERAYPHRMLKWEWSAVGKPTGRGWSPSEGLDAGALTGSARLPYWKLHEVGDEKYLKLLGLTAGPGGATAPGGVRGVGEGPGERR
jgi:hypothetical protein